MYIELVMLSNHLILFHPLHFLPSIFSSIRVYFSEVALVPGGQSTGTSAPALVLSMNIEGQFLFELNDFISLLSKRLSRVLSKTTIQKHQFFGIEVSAVATGLEKVSFYSNPKERQCQRMFKLLHNCTHLTC